MATARDKTLTDNNRRELSFLDTHAVREVLPEFFVETYPRFVEFLEAYYEFEHGKLSPSHLIHELFETRDIDAVDPSLLSFIEDELLLGEQYFEGFKDKRAAAKLSSVLYRSKGTLFSMQQFFRMFYGINPDIEYPKKYIFTVGESVIGSESQRFILDNKLYQQYAVLIKLGIPLSVWKQPYKLFVHPAGVYLGSELQIAGDGEVDIFAPDALEDTDTGLKVTSTASVFGSAETEITGLATPRYGIHGTAFDDALLDSEYSVVTRIRLPRSYAYENLTIDQFDRIYDTIDEAGGKNSPTFDEDSDGTDFRVPRLSSTTDTMDEIKLDVYDPLGSNQ